MTCKEGRALCGALTAVMTGIAYKTSAEMAGELGTFPGYKKNAAHMLRVIRNHRRAAHGQAYGYEALARQPGAARPRLLPASRPDRACDEGLGRRARARRNQRLSQRPDHRDRADRHHRPGHGLRHHRHRARLRAGEVQEARRRRLLQDHQPRGARGAARARLSRERDRRDRGLCRRPRLALQRARHQRLHAEGQGLHRRGDRQGRKGPADRLRHQVRLQQVDPWRRLHPRPARHRRRGDRGARTSTCSSASASPSARSRPPTSTSAAR